MGPMQSSTDDVAIDLWAFRQSCWDSAAFLGDPAVMCAAESVVQALLLLLNVFIQVSFTIIILTSHLTEWSVNAETIEGYHRWRTATGHDMSLMDPLTTESLVSRVCRQDASLHISENQVQQVSFIDSYLHSHFFFNGPLMCGMAS